MRRCRRTAAWRSCRRNVPTELAEAPRVATDRQPRRDRRRAHPPIAKATRAGAPIGVHRIHDIGVTPGRLAAFASGFGRELPGALAALYASFDGEERTSLLGWRGLPMAEASEVAARMRGRSVRNDVGGGKEPRPFRWAAEWIPFAQDANGDLAFVAPKLLGEKRPAGMGPFTEPGYLWFHDEDRISFEAWSAPFALPRVFERMPTPRYPMGR